MPISLPSPNLQHWLFALAFSFLLHMFLALSITVVPIPDQMTQQTWQRLPDLPKDTDIDVGITIQLGVDPITKEIVSLPQKNRHLPGKSDEKSNDDPQQKPFEVVFLPEKNGTDGIANTKDAQSQNANQGDSQTSAGLQQGNGKGSLGGTEFFGVAANAKKIIYVIDRSSSMGLNGALDRACYEIWNSLQALPETAQIQIVVYNSHAQMLMPTERNWLTNSKSNQHRVGQALKDLRAEGGTKHYLALPLALSLQPEVIYFLTDADDLTLEYLKLVTERNRHQTRIHVIELNTHHLDHTDMPLQVFARANGGQYRAVDLLPK